MAMVSVRTANISDSEAISELMSQLGYASSPELIERKLKEFEVRDYDQVFVALQGVRDCRSYKLPHYESLPPRWCQWTYYKPGSAVRSERARNRQATGARS